MKKNYTRQEKINYYKGIVQRLKAEIIIKRHRINRIEQRLKFIASDEYQDWNSDLQNELNNKKATG